MNRFSCCRETLAKTTSALKPDPQEDEENPGKDENDGEDGEPKNPPAENPPAGQDDGETKEGGKTEGGTEDEEEPDKDKDGKEDGEPKNPPAENPPAGQDDDSTKAGGETEGGTEDEEKPDKDKNTEADTVQGTNPVDTARPAYEIIDGGIAVLDLPSAENAVIVPPNLLAFVQREQLGMALDLPAGSVVFGKTAVENIARYAGNRNITVTVEPVGQTEADRWEVYRLTISGADSGLMTDFGGNVQVSLPYPLKENERPNAVVVSYISEDGGLLPMPDSRYEDGHAVFTTTHFSEYRIGCHPVAFRDVQNHWAQDVIERAAAHDLVSGCGDGTFAPDANVTRAEFVQMMNNVLSLPAVPADGRVYSDVASGDWFCFSVSAAKQAGLLNGLGTDEFYPNRPVTRRETALILANAARLRNAQIDPAELFAETQAECVTRAQAVQIQTALLEAVNELN